MREVRIVETVVRVGRHGPEPGGWRVLLCDGGVVIRDYPCRDQRRAGRNLGTGSVSTPQRSSGRSSRLT